MTARRARSARTGRAVAAPVQGGLWGEDAPAPATDPGPELPPTNHPEQWARVLASAAADPGYVVAAHGHARGGRRVMVRVPGTEDRVTPVPAADAAVLLAALDTGHAALGSGARTVRHGRAERPAVRVLVPTRTRALLARWAALHPLRED